MDKGENAKDMNEEVEGRWHKREKEPYGVLGEVWKKFPFRIFHCAVSKAHNKHFIILVCTTVSHSTYENMFTFEHLGLSLPCCSVTDRG